MNTTHSVATAPDFSGPGPNKSGRAMRLVRSARAGLRNQTVCVIVTLLAGTAISFLITTVRGIPAPVYQDEFGYLLGADTFASGRVTNPTHPMWQHFESFHIIHQPSYTSKYHPAQSLTLAVGQWIGHPVYGAVLANGVSMAALVWMLTGWLPRKYYWLAVLFVSLHPGFQIAWGQSYWGGAVALTGASLLLGAFARLTGAFEIRFAVIAGFGTVLLANSRPFEGAVLTAVVGVALIWKLVRIPEWKLKPFLLRVISPGVAVLGLGAGLMMSYNAAVTGNPLEMPYSIHEAEYGWTPLFLWQKAGEKPTYRHASMEASYVWDKEFTESRFKSISDVGLIKLGSAIRVLLFFCGNTLLVAVFMLPLLWRRSRYRLALILAIPAFFAGMVTPWEWSHYCAPAAPLVILLLIVCWIELWKCTRQGSVLRIAIVLFVVAVQFKWGLSAWQTQAEVRQKSWATQRVAIESKLANQPGRDLILVRYSESHDPPAEWVYNRADIDGAEVVWAREISGESRNQLVRYFRDRNVWVVDADEEPAVLRPFVDSEAVPSGSSVVSR